MESTPRESRRPSDPMRWILVLLVVAGAANPRAARLSRRQAEALPRSPEAVAQQLFAKPIAAIAQPLVRQSCPAGAVVIASYHVDLDLAFATPLAIGEACLSPSDAGWNRSCQPRAPPGAGSSTFAS